MEEQNSKKRARDESDLDSAEVKRLRDDLLSVVDDSDPGTACADLDSFLKSFEEEICAPAANAVSTANTPPFEAEGNSNSGASQPELGYLLEASDDDLGLPPSAASSGEVENDERAELMRFPTESSGLVGLWEFEDQIPTYDSFELGIYGFENYNSNDGEYVAIDGLFDHSGVGLESSDCYNASPWLPETLPAQ